MPRKPPPRRAPKTTAAAAAAAEVVEPVTPLEIVPPVEAVDTSSADPLPVPRVQSETPWKLQLVELDVELVDLDTNNVNEHNDDSLKAVAASLVEFGQQKPIVVVPTENGRFTVIAGNATLRQARAQGWPKISSVVSTLEGNDAMAYAIADNRTNRLSTWNYKALQTQLRALATAGFNMPATGWFGGELGNMINTSWTPPAAPPGEGTADAPPAEDEDDEQPVIAESLAFTADEWVLLNELKTKMGAGSVKGAVLLLAQKALGANPA